VQKFGGDFFFKFDT